MRTTLTANCSECWAASALQPLCLPLFVSLLQALEPSTEFSWSDPPVLFSTTNLEGHRKRRKLQSC